MQAGKLNQRIAIQVNTPTVDSYGQPIPGWATVKTIWASAETSGGKEFYAAQKLYAEMDTLFTIRHDDSITYASRILWDGRTFEIIAPPYDPDAGRKMHKIAAKAVI